MKILCVVHNFGDMSQELGTGRIFGKKSYKGGAAGGSCL